MIGRTASRTANFCVDAQEPRAQVAWWAQVLDDLEPLATIAPLAALAL